MTGQNSQAPTVPPLNVLGGTPVNTQPYQAVPQQPVLGNQYPQVPYLGQNYGQNFFPQNPALGQVPQPAVPVNQEYLANLIEQMYGPRLQRINRPLYRKPYYDYIDRDHRGYKIPEFTLFSSQEKEVSQP